MVMLKLVTLLMVLAVANAAVNHELQKVEPGEPYECRGEDGRTHKPGSEWFVEGQCIKKVCSALNKNELDITGYSCGAIGGSEHCLVADLDKNYPDCCPTLLHGCE